MKEKLQNITDKLKQDCYSYMNGDNKPISQIPIQWYYSTLFPEMGIPTTVEIDINIGVPMIFVDFAKTLGFIQISQSIIYEPNTTSLGIMNMAFVHEDGYLIHIETQTKNTKTTDVRINKFIEKLHEINNDGLDYVKKPKQLEKNYLIRYISSIEIFAPSIHCIDNKKFRKLLLEIGDWIQQYDKREKIKDSALIHMMVREEYDTYFKDFDVSNFSPKLVKPDVFYGKGFAEFNQNLLNRLNTERKGVVLFHGEPGTGKTHYVRYLLRELTNINKRVIYVPPSMVEGMAEPSMMSFLTNNIMEEARDTILLIEDAEPLLESRELGGGRTTGISNLLNSTDGLLNDILGLVIIATFNTNLYKIDQALLRPGRLMARKEFGKHNYQQALTIAEEINLKEIFEKNAKPGDMYTIAEICNFSKDREVLLHEIKDENRKIGFS
jgi:hypothetical protein